MLTAEEIIERYELEPLDQEGGFFKQVWKSGLRIENSVLEESFPAQGSHPMGTIIYFLLTKSSFSAMHRLPTAEHWFYHLGDPAEMLVLTKQGRGDLFIIGPEIESGEKPYHMVPENCWQGTTLLKRKNDYGYFFGSCVMVPGFEWNDFELGEREELVQQFPQFTDEITERTRTGIFTGAK